MITNPNDMRALVYELSTAAWSLAAIGALFESGIAEELTTPRTLEEIAATCPGIPARRLEKILAVASVHGVLATENGRYRLADGVVPAVCGPMKMAITGELRSNLMQPLALLDSARGKTASTAWNHTDPMLLQAQGDSSSVLPPMLKNMIAPNLGDLAQRLERPGAKLLDIGTGVGGLAIAAARTFPQLHVVGVDMADAPLTIARAAIARAGVTDRIELRKMQVQELRDEGTYVLAWLPAFFVAPDHLPAAIARVTAALEPGGWLLLGCGGGGDARQRAINELVCDTWGGPTPQANVVEGHLREAGLVDVRTLPGPPWAPQMLAGRRPA